MTATAGDTRATVEWVASSCGASTVIDYTVTANPGGQSTTTGPTARSTTVSGLTNGQSYAFVVSARNGQLDTQAPTSEPVTPSGPPRPPTVVTPTAGDASATVHWSTADANGAPPILEYEIKASSGLTAYASGTQNDAVIGPLNNHQPYTFTVAARNANGWGLHSAPSVEVTPIGPVTGTATAFSQSFVEDPVDIDVVYLRNQLSWDWDGICTREQNVSDATEDHFQQSGWRLDSFTINRSRTCEGTVITSNGAWHNDPFCPKDTTHADLQNTLTGHATGTYAHTWTDEVRGGCSSLLTPVHTNGYVSGPSNVQSVQPPGGPSGGATTAASSGTSADLGED
ncbi:MAG: fibronectin type III domain-containing protein [Acidimicrobiales bacterium]